MKKSKPLSRPRVGRKNARVFGAVIFVTAILAVGMITAMARYHSGRFANTSPKQSAPASNSKAGFVTIDVGGRKLQVNAQTLQQGPLSQEQAQQLAAALKENKSTDGLVEVQRSDGSVSMDLQGRFQNVILAKKNDDGSLSQACVNNSEAAGNFLQSNDSNTQQTPGRKVTVVQ